MLYEWVLGTLAAVGLICILKSLYAIIKKEYLRTDSGATLLLYGRASEEEAERAMLAAARVQTEYFPQLHVIYAGVDGGEMPCVKTMASRLGVTYIEQHRGIQTK